MGSLIPTCVPEFPLPRFTNVKMDGIQAIDEEKDKGAFLALI